jgi:FkbM family methyltransferase
MKKINYLAKKLLDLFLRHPELHSYGLQIVAFLTPKRRKYAGIKRFTATMNGISVQFGTEDKYSHSWFFPRYAGVRIHERPVTEMFIEALRGAKCVVDIGAHLGWYTFLAAKHMPLGTVYGFEMDDLNFALLQKNMAMNHCDNVHIYNAAISDLAGIVSYQRKNNRPSPGFRLRPDMSSEISSGFMTVHSIKLDDFFDDRGIAPDIIKIDVEGAEMNVLQGIRRTLIESRPILFLEIHPYALPEFKTSAFEILSSLLENRYKVFEIKAMRSHESSKHLMSLRLGSVLHKNTMLYAEAIR